MHFFQFYVAFVGGPTMYVNMEKRAFGDIQVEHYKCTQWIYCKSILTWLYIYLWWSKISSYT